MQTYIPEIAKGLAITMKHFFNNTKDLALGQRNDPVLEAVEDGINTLSYPEQRRPYPTRFRGLHRLTHRDDGSPRCVACLCCSTACPAQCIHIEAAEYPEGDPKRGYERFHKRFVIDELRCIFCGFCVAACPCDAIRMDTGMHAAPYDSRDQFWRRGDARRSGFGVVCCAPVLMYRQYIHSGARESLAKTQNLARACGCPGEADCRAALSVPFCCAVVLEYFVARRGVLRRSLRRL